MEMGTVRITPRLHTIPARSWRITTRFFKTGLKPSRMGWREDSRICPVSRTFRRKPALVNPNRAPATIIKNNTQTDEEKFRITEIVINASSPEL